MKGVVLKAAIIAVVCLLFGCGNGSTDDKKNIVSDEILNDTGTSILGCDYTEMNPSKNGRHYFLNISVSFSDAETTIKNALGFSPTFDCQISEHSPTSESFVVDKSYGRLIIEVIPGWNQVRLVECVPETDPETDFEVIFIGKGWGGG